MSAARAASWHLPVLLIVGILLVGGRWVSHVKFPTLPLYIADIALLLALLIWTVQGLRRPMASELSSHWSQVTFLLVGVAGMRWVLSPDPLSLLSFRDVAPFLYLGVVTLLTMTGRWGQRGEARTNRLLRTALYVHAAWFTIASWASVAGLPLEGPEIAADVRILQLRPDFDAGLAAAAAALLMFGTAKEPRSLPRGLGVGAASVVALTVIVASATRAGLLVLLVTVLLSLSPGRDLSSAARRFLIPGTAVAGVSAILLIGGPSGFAGQAQSTSQNSLERAAAIVSDIESGSGTAGARVSAWTSILSYMGDEYRWATGTGFGNNFVADSGAVTYLSGSQEVRAPHMALVTVYARLGVVGLAIFLWWLVLLARQIWRFRGARLAQPAAYVAAALLISSMVGVILESPFGMIPLAFAAAVLHRGARAVD